MKFTLKDYQEQAVSEVLDNLDTARNLYHASKPKVSSVALTATTGAGKTVMAAAVIESLFFGNEDYDFAPDPGAVVLWFSDDPSLNEQTRFRLMQASDKLTHPMLKVIEHPFRERQLQPGKVYFLNTAKLSKSSLLTRGHDDAADDANRFPGLEAKGRPDLQTFTIWETIQNTIEDPRLTLYMILDEAHRGMGAKAKESKDKPTIVKRLINGHAGIPPMPVVLGVSATIKRFDDAMAAAEVSSSRVLMGRVTVDVKLVQQSGLLKDDIILDFPAEAGDFNTALVARATEKVMASTEAWAEYAQEQSDDELVVPLMVLQSPDTPDENLLREALDVIFDTWPDLSTGAVAHVFGDHSDLKIGSYVIPHISPEKVQDATHIRVLLAKSAISTGWDCPRAEVLMSFRPAKDATNITQMLGRMIRTPLARRIDGNEKLNAVECILPRFNKATATAVVDALNSTEGMPDPDDDRRVLLAPGDMTPNPTISDVVWAAYDTLPSQSIPRKVAKPVKRLTTLAQALSKDGLRPDAGKEAHKSLHGVLDGLLARYPDQLETEIAGVIRLEGGTVISHQVEGKREDAAFELVADDRAIQQEFRAGARVITPALARSYVDHLAPDTPDADEDGLRDAYIKVAALAKLPDVAADLARAADALATKWLNEHRVQIKALTDVRQHVYNDIRAMSTEPQRIDLTRPELRIEETKRREGDGLDAQLVDLPTRPHHLLSDAEGNFPVGSLNEWEIEVLDKEFSDHGAIAWYRNPSRVSDVSLGVAYKASEDAWRTLRPDFLFFTQTGPEVEVSIVDPHGHHLSDALPKLRGLADFAAEYGDEFFRIEAVAKLGDTLRVLDLKQEPVRKAVAKAENAKSLYEGSMANDY